jgi:hemin uptake protein HemP
LRSEQLFGGEREILIEHGTVFYRLRITQSNKLILTK